VTNDSIRTSLSSDFVVPFIHRCAVTLDVTLAALTIATSPVGKLMDIAEVDNPPFRGPKGYKGNEGNDPPFGGPKGNNSPFRACPRLDRG
jgi:hypothetical protein